MAKVTQFVFYVFLGIYVVLLLLNPQLAPIEEARFLDTLQIGKYYPFEIHLYEARFHPLQSQEYNLVTLLLPPTPFSYYLFNALQLVVFFLIFAKILNFVTNNKSLIYLSLLLLLFSPGLITVWFRLVFPERGILFFTTLCLYLYLKILKRIKDYSKAKLIIILSAIVLFANLAIYHKETVFLALGSFAFFHLVLSWKQSNFKIKLLDGLLILSSLVFILIYYFAIYLNSGTTNYAEALAPSSTFGNIKIILDYVFSDPLLILCLLPLTGWRLYQICLKKQIAYPVYDAMLMAALIYIIAFLKLKLQTQYYLLPAYIFAIPAMLFFITQFQPRLMAKKWWIAAFGTAIFIQITSALPMGLETLSDFKYIPLNANQTFDFLVDNIKSRYPNQRADIFLDGIYRGRKNYIYHDFGEFLKYKGLTQKNFDIKSDLPSNNEFPWEENPNSPYSALRSKEAAKISKGDYLVITPYSYKDPTDSYMNNLESEYKLLFRTRSQWAIPNIGLQRVIKYFLIIMLPEEKTKTMFHQGLKLFKPVVDYYVFIRK